MDVDRIYKLMGSALKRVYGYYITRPIQRFNVDNRAEKIVEQQKSVPKVAPRHENTDQLFQRIIQNNPQLKKDLNEKHEDLLKRLNSVKVVSKDREISELELQEMQEIRERVKNRLPRSRTGTDIPIHAYTEPAHVPIGRISLIRSLNFIGKHAKDPEEYDAETIAIQHKLDEEEVKHILDYFKPYYGNPTSEVLNDPVEDTEKELGVPLAHFHRVLTDLKPKSWLRREQIMASGDHQSEESQLKEKEIK